MYVYGQLLRAAVETLGADPSTVADKFTGRLWYNTATELLKFTTTGNVVKTVTDTDSAQTLTNKTLTTPIIASISNTGLLTLPTSADTLVGRATTDTLTNKTLTSPIMATIVNGAGTLTLPSSTDTLVGRATTDTLTNKTLTSPIMATIVNGAGTLTLPSSTDTLVGRATTDTLTNKTLTSPIIGTIVNGAATLTLPVATGTLATLAGTEVFTNKDYDGGTAANTRRFTLPKDTKTNLDLLTRKAGTLVFDTVGLKPYYDNGVSLSLIGSGSGGGLNYIATPDAETDTTGWVVGSDALLIDQTNTATENLRLHNRTTATTMVAIQATDAFVLGGTVANGGMTLGSTYYLPGPFANTTFTSSTGLYGINSVSTTSGGAAVNQTTNAGDLVSWLQPTSFLGGSGTVVTPTITWTRSSTTPMVSTNHFLLTKPASNCVGQFVAYDFTIDNAYQGQQLAINALFKVVSGTYATDDLKFRIFDKTNGIAIEPSASSVTNTSLSGPLQTMVFQSSYNSTSYRLVLWISSQSLLAYSLGFDSFSVGPQVVPVGAAMSDWATYTPTGAWTTNTTYTGKWRRVGDSLEAEVKISVSGAPAALDMTASVPAGYTIDTAKLVDSGVQTVGVIHGGIGAGNFVGTVIMSSTTTVRAVSTAVWTNTFPATWGAGNYATFVFTVPIVGWASNVLSSDSAASRVVSIIASNPSSAVTGAPTDITTWGTVDKDTHGAFNATTGVYTVVVPGVYDFRGAFLVSGTYALNTPLEVDVLKNGVVYRSYQARAGGALNNNNVIFSGDIDVRAGDLIKLQIITSATTPAFNAGAVWNSFSMSLRQGPSQIQAATVVAARYSTAVAQSIGTSGATVIWGTKDFDTTGSMNTATGVYTCPAPGYYAIHSTLVYTSAAFTAGAAKSVQFYKNGALHSYTNISCQVAYTGSFGVYGSNLIYCNAGDTLAIFTNANEAAARSLSGTGVENYVTISRMSGVN